jgi:hypothetical protein
MAEQEVIKHTEKIFNIWGAANKGFWHKLREFIIEIIIIVFAVSLSIYLHDQSEKKHQHYETKAFLLGLRQDLLLDIEEMKQDKKSFYSNLYAFKYFTSLKQNELPASDSINKHYTWLISITSLIPNNGRFEGTKNCRIILWIFTRKVFPHCLPVPVHLMAENNS